MKKILFLLIVLSLPTFMLAQEKEAPKYGVKFSGFVRNDMIFNTRQVLSARAQSNVLLAPQPIVLDANDNDINAVPNFNLSSFTTRVRAKITGPESFGAKTSGLIESDFIGPNGTATFALRLRHAMFKLDWESSQLLAGQYWHPMWATECFPGTVSFGAGVPFNPLSRNPQLRYTKKFGSLSILAAAISQGMFKSKGDVMAHQNSSIPEVHLQLQFKNDLISAGAGVNYQVLMPRTSSVVVDIAGNSVSYVTDVTVPSLSYFGYVKIKAKPVTAKVYAMYGQNNDNMVMMGGYAVTDMNYTNPEGFVEYTPYNTMSTWVDFETTGKKVKYGLFAGYAQNMGAVDSVQTSTYVGRWGNVNSMMRVAPRVMFISGKVKLAFEVEYSTIDYASQEVDNNGVAVVGSDAGGIDIYGKVTNFTTADNIKALMSISYTF